MSFEDYFDYWIAKKVANLLKEGYTFEQVKKLMNMIYSDFFDLLGENYLVYLIKGKFETTLELFERVENE